jgi:DNA-binding winged helix-turn-helix (wHTH) protein/TolB-like protein/Flp pilus assembly protein TadD
MQEKYLYGFDKFHLDAEKRKLKRDDELVSLPPKAFDLLLLLVENQERVVEKEFLMESLWQDTFVEESNLTQNIYLLRKILGKTHDGKSFIETRSKRGYKFVPDVRLITAAEDPLIIYKTTHLRARITTEEIEDETNGISVNNGERTLDSAKNPLLPKAAQALSTRTLLNDRAFAALAVLFVVGVAGIYFWNRNRPVEMTQIKSIAVMPFKTIGGEETDEEFLGLGMADAIITRLGKTGKINVSPTDAVRRYSEKGTDALATARALDVETVLTGNIQRSGDKVRVTVQLLRLSDRQPLWTDQFDEKSADILTLQDSISQKLAGALMLKLSGDEQKRLAKKDTENVEAYQLYLKGRYYWSKRTTEWVQKAIVCFEQAVRLDPNYSQAYAGLADAYAVTASGLLPNERFPKAKAAAERALQLDETLAEAHTSLAFILYKFEWNWLEAENHFRRAIEINPSYALAHHWYGEFLGLMGRFDEGLAELKEAERLDPLSLALKDDVGRLFYRARHYDEAIEQARKTLELEPNFRNAYISLMRCYQQKEMYAEAVEADLKSLSLSNYPPGEIEELKNIFAASGWQAYWRRQLETQRQQNQIEYVPSYHAIEIYLRLGETETALRLLEKSYDERSDAPLYVRTEPPLEALHSDSRFQYLLRRSGL